MKLKHFILLLCLMPLAIVLGQKAGDRFEVDGIEYELKTYQSYKESNPGELQNDYLAACVISVHCAGNHAHIDIPFSVYYLGKSFLVVAIGDYAFSYCCELAFIRIPDSLKFIECDDFDMGYNLFCEDDRPQRLDISKATLTLGREILGYSLVSVSKDNSRYMAKDGILFSKEQDTLFCYPAQKTDTLYNIPSGVKNIMPNAFAYCTNLKSVTIPASMPAIGDSAF